MEDIVEKEKLLYEGKAKKNRNEIKIQPSDTYKDLVFKEVVVINDNEYIVVYENSKQGFYIRLI